METHTLDWASVFPYVRFVSRSGVPGNAKDVRRQEVFLSSYICALTNYQFDFQNLSPQCNLFFKVVGSIKFSPLSLRSSPRSYAGRPEFWKKPLWKARLLTPSFNEEMCHDRLCDRSIADTSMVGEYDRAERRKTCPLGEKGPFSTKKTGGWVIFMNTPWWVSAHDACYL